MQKLQKYHSLISPSNHSKLNARIEFEVGDDGEEIAFVDHRLHEDSELATERIYMSIASSH